MVIRTGTRDEIDEFANAIGEWLLTQEFGSIRPLAFRHRLGWDRDEDESYVVIELLVSDPPSPPPPEELSQMSREELAAVLSWPLDDWKAVFAAAQERGKELGPPPGILPHWPVDVRMFAEREVDRSEFPA